LRGLIGGVQTFFTNVSAAKQSESPAQVGYVGSTMGTDPDRISRRFAGPPQTVTGGGAAPVRNGLLDYCRLAAAVGIVWFHAKAPGFQVAYAALPFFLFCLAQPTRSGLTDRVARLLTLYIIWWAVYALLWMGVALYYGLDIFVWWRPWMIVAGTSVHLWFLPFALVVALATPGLRGFSGTVALPVVAAVGLALVGETRAFPWYQWSLALIPVLVGFAYFADRRWAVWGLLASFVILEVFRPSPDNAVILWGAGLAIAAFTISLPATWLSDWCARLSLWVYLNHMLVIFFVEANGATGVPLAVITAGASIALAVMMELALQRLGPVRA
jgi:hypothetical protein